MIPNEYYDWTSNESGAATVAIPFFKGYVIKAVRSVPGECGDLATDLPTNLYSITLINDLTGADILVSQGANRSGSVADDALYPNPSIPVPCTMTLTIASAGVAKQGRVYIDFQDT